MRNRTRERCGHQAAPDVNLPGTIPLLSGNGGLGSPLGRLKGKIRHVGKATNPKALTARAFRVK
jgi:hypothetical protein